MLELLLAHGLDATAAIATAAWDGREEIVDLLLAHGARLDEALDGSRPILNELVRWGQFAPARLLLARGASPNLADERGWTAMHQAVSRGNVKILRDLVAAGGDPRRPDLDGRTPRGMAKAKQRLDLLALLP
jgi:ankyrin repeat protein